MALFGRKTPLEKEWQLLLKQEYSFWERQKKRKENALTVKLEEKIPANLQSTLNTAFTKAFQLIFEKGTGLIEKSYPVQERKQRFQINDYTDDLRQNRKSLRRFGKDASAAGRGNTLLSGAAGVGMGLLGVGIPDIPVFTALLLKNLYEISISYGYDYTLPEERWFILRLIETALRSGEDYRWLDENLNAAICPDGTVRAEDCGAQLKETAEALSDELLYMKFLQGIPVVGAVGGACDAIVMNRVSRYARLKYQRRLLTKKGRG